jgi:hypothetical protein
MCFLVKSYDWDVATATSQHRQPRLHLSCQSADSAIRTPAYLISTVEIVLNSSYHVQYWPSWLTIALAWRKNHTGYGTWRQTCCNTRILTDFPLLQLRPVRHSPRFLGRTTNGRVCVEHKQLPVINGIRLRVRRRGVVEVKAVRWNECIRVFDVEQSWWQKKCSCLCFLLIEPCPAPFYSDVVASASGVPARQRNPHRHGQDCRWVLLTLRKTIGFCFWRVYGL